MLKIKNKLVLGSASPRRKELLNHIISDFEVRSSDIAEVYPPALPVEEIAGFLSELKWKNLMLNSKEGEIFLTSDTTVILDNVVFGKPTNRAEAIEMLSALSGRTHRVVTAITLGNQTHMTP